MICSIIKSALNNVKPYEMEEEKDLHTICYNVSFLFLPNNSSQFIKKYTTALKDMFHGLRRYKKEMCFQEDIRRVFSEFLAGSNYQEAYPDYVISKIIAHGVDFHKQEDNSYKYLLSFPKILEYFAKPFGDYKANLI